MIKHLTARLRPYWGIIALSVVVFGFFTLYSVVRHEHFGSSGFDLGIFDQTVWHYSRFERPANTVRVVPNILGDHFHPILMLLAPLYWIWASPNTLLIAQAALFASAMIPIWLFVRRRLGAGPAYLFALTFALFWGVQNAVAFDFHEIAFAVPLIAWIIYCIDIKKWRPYWLLIGLLLLVKEDQAMLAAFIGVYLLTQREYRRGLITSAVGVCWFFLATQLFIPFFAGQADAYSYWTYTQLGPDMFSALRSIVLHPGHALTVLTKPITKLSTGWWLFAPTALLSFLSPLTILAVPLVMERFMSNIPEYWLRVFHYSATISPVIIMAAADGLHRLSKRWPDRNGRTVWTISILILLINVVLLPRSPLWKMTDPSWYRATADVRTGYQALGLIPPTASVTAQDVIVPHLSERATIYGIRDGAPRESYIITSANLSPWPYRCHGDIEHYLEQARQTGYDQIFAHNGWTVLRRR